MKKICTILTAVILSANVWGQTPIYQWGYGMGGTFAFGNNEFGADIKVDGSNNVYILGSYTDAYDADPGVGVINLTSLAPGNQNIVVSKYNISGNVIWAKGINAPNTSNLEPRKLQLDTNGNLYFTGFYSGTVDFDAGVGVSNLTADINSFDIFIAKYDNNGNFVWARGMGGNGTDIGRQIQIDGSGNVYLGASFYNTVDFDPGVGVANVVGVGANQNIALAKFDSNGSFLWAKSFGNAGGDVTCGGIELDVGNNILITGDFAGTVDFDPSAGTANRISNGGSDIFLGKYDNNGNYITATSFGGSGYESGGGIKLDANNYYVTGYFYNTVDFDPNVGVANLTSAGNTDVFIAKYDLSFNYVFAKQIGAGGYEYISPYGASISLDNASNIYIVGTFANTVDFDPGAGTANLSIVGGTDGYIAKYDNNGNYISVGALSGNLIDSPLGTTVNANSSEVYVIGYFNSTPIDLDPGPGTANYTCLGNCDIYFGKYATCVAAPSQPGAIIGLTSICANTTNTYSIAAVIGATSYTWTLPNGWSGTSITNSINTTANATGGNITVTANNSCGTSQAQTLAVTVNPIYTTNTSAAICQGDSILLAGTYKKIAGVYNDNLLSIKGCDSTVVATLTVNPLPTANLGAFTAVCANAAAFALTGGFPAGGTYSGVGVNNNQFDPVVAGAGTHTITYTYTDGNTGCSNSATNTIVVNPLPPTPIITVNGTTFTSSAANGNQWYLNGNPINGATNQSFVCTVNGNYTVCVTDANGCKSCSAVLNFTTIGISENQNENKVSIYPNPFSSNITVIAGTKSILAIYNTLGELVYSTQLTAQPLTINLEEVPTGIYFLQVKNENGIVTKKIIKK